jgi:hypothetical protein
MQQPRCKAHRIDLANDNSASRSAAALDAKPPNANRHDTKNITTSNTAHTATNRFMTSPPQGRCIER